MQGTLRTSNLFYLKLSVQLSSFWQWNSEHCWKLRHCASGNRLLVLPFCEQMAGPECYWQTSLNTSLNTELLDILGRWALHTPLTCFIPPDSSLTGCVPPDIIITLCTPHTPHQLACSTMCVNAERPSRKDFLLLLHVLSTRRVKNGFWATLWQWKDGGEAV